MRFRDLSGQRFGRLFVCERAPDHVKTNGGHQTTFRCLCDCGNTTVVLAYNLKNGHTTSCGCLGAERRGESKRTHGGSRTRLHGIWAKMKQRCLNPNDARYQDYGGRGIQICDEWVNNYDSFQNWAVASGYAPDLTLDRIDNDGNYQPSNCRWVTKREQSNNTRKNRHIEHDGESHTLAEWSRITGVNALTIAYRLNVGWSVSDALFTPVRGCSK